MYLNEGHWPSLVPLASPFCLVHRFGSPVSDDLPCHLNDIQFISLQFGSVADPDISDVVDKTHHRCDRRRNRPAICQSCQLRTDNHHRCHRIGFPESRGCTLWKLARIAFIHKQKVPMRWAISLFPFPPAYRQNRLGPMIVLGVRKRQYSFGVSQRVTGANRSVLSVGFGASATGREFIVCADSVQLRG